MPVEREQQDKKNCPSKSANHASEHIFYRTLPGDRFWLYGMF